MINDKNKINYEELDNVTGGMIVYGQGLPEFDPFFPWEVVENNNCRVLGKFQSKDEAIRYAKSFGPETYNAQDTDIATVLRLRANPQGGG